MIARIQQLPAEVSNQIAAGEVIERPASVVKELLENSLDAGASVIQIEIDAGGLNRIKISDNGQGIVGEDLPLAISAHATSKICATHDLFAITTMGFRGEALASIASVSRFKLISKPASQSHAMALMIEGGLNMQIKPYARTNGTTVEVCDLFFNTPVRKNFFKTVAREYDAIETVVKKFAMSNPKIALSLSHNGKNTLRCMPAICDTTQQNRLQRVMGKGFVLHATFIKIDQDNLKLEGWISGRAYHRSQNDKLWVYINQRIVKDKLVYQIIKQSYEGVLPPGRFPACLLYLSMPTVEVDVNVHPTKYEVRFRYPRQIRDLFLSALGNVLTEESVNPTKDAPVYNVQAEDNITFSRWVNLNEHFAILFFNDKPFLINIYQICCERIATYLQTTPKPLPSRTLLVPMCVPININCNKALLANWGIIIDLLSENTIILRAIPQALPRLDLKLLLQRLGQQQALDDVTLSRILIECQWLDARQLDMVEQQDLALYIQTEILSANIKSPWIRPLDLQACRELFYA